MITCKKETFLERIQNDDVRDIIDGRLKIKEIERRDGKEHAKKLSEISTQIGMQELFIDIDTGVPLTFDEMVSSVIHGNLLNNPKASLKDLREMQAIRDNETEKQLGMVVQVIPNGQDISKLAK